MKKVLNSQGNNEESMKGMDSMLQGLQKVMSECGLDKDDDDDDDDDFGLGEGL